ncbi:hypothetical protein TSTA_020550 [Talaromyces stipitatus ATCC 10500]|uniref:Heterokaryon incompatibility domain-containing protein n=1 Tax=Talaromyces stipitatus (strain ATCC 10500 / CBS 375.48 / QM 6759 / NRRL 1006) TaxID=441959 RepID=B8MFK8_TALSN|nr:uncharacterized protein TSTA_020550 [Talaromyces stipitatus ATCC 10500]EED16998.1 hypothetical protein TSTA_020550 [Talaromyces stipitatus ATCC 10500]
MEHLPLLEGIKPLIIVPYEAPEKDWYDGGGFLDYPQRSGWAEEQLRGGDDTTKEDYLDANVFYTKGNDIKLFFGLAIGFFKIGGVHVKTEDFLVDANVDGVDPDMPKMINTSKLSQLLTEWKANVETKDRFCVPGYENESLLKQEKSRPWPVRDDVSTAMIGLTFSLWKAAMCEVPHLHGRSELLWKRLQQKWCIDDVTTTFKELDIDGHYYLAASPGLANAIGRIIEKDAIPIALWVKGLRTLWSVDYHLTGKRKPDYVAISHIWTDGKGNPSTSPILAIISRLYQSNWIKRLWTHQEGFLSDLNYPSEDSNSDWHSKVYILFSDKSVELDDLYQQFSAYQKRQERLEMLYGPITDAVSQRKTSQLADEIVCLATIIDIDVKPFLDLPDKTNKDLAQERMALFLKTLHTFEMHFVFNNYATGEKGYKWAPRSSLSFRTAELYYGEDERTADLQIVNGKGGLLVQYPGFLIQFDSGRPPFGTNERGCVISYR